MNYLAASERSKRAVHKNLLHDDMICTPIHGGLFDCVDAIRSVRSGGGSTPNKPFLSWSIALTDPSVPEVKATRDSPQLQALYQERNS